MEHRRNSFGKSIPDGAEKGFVADIGFPGDLPLPTHEGLQYKGSIHRQKSLEESAHLAAASHAHDKIARQVDQIAGLGPVNESTENMQGSALDTLNAELDQPLDPIPELPEKKGIVARAVESVTAAAESVAAAAGSAAGTVAAAAETAADTVAEIFHNATASKSSEEDHHSVGGQLKRQKTDDAGPKEKGLIDSAIDKVWNVLTGKEEIGQQTEELGQRTDRDIVEHSILNADAPVFVPHGFVPLVDQPLSGGIPAASLPPARNDGLQ
ncbi:hypothetical protein BV898_06167 [Hypsibius exemplaris]|uniref:Uncharacterized protein n=1 Tax=Hypsibius exemplaris TaxID=2072580 RepID=A0A1W0WXG5_HYPEX|nr:hypothetical protein BV898_06167 [Hypsibius exemplaris]